MRGTGKDTYSSVVDNKYTVHALVGKELLAKDNVAGFYDYVNSNSLKMIVKGQIIGTVFTWLVKNGVVFWAFKDNKGRLFFVKHDTKKMQMNPYDAQTTPTATEEAQAANVQAQKDSQGVFVYYVERWGKPVLITTGLVAAAYIGGKIIKLAQSRKQ